MNEQADAGRTESGTRELSNVDIVLYALLLLVLDGQRSKVHTEHVAYKAFQLDPGRFGWRLKEYSKFPDREPVRIALEDAKKTKYGHLVEGRSGVGASGKEEDGWMFTPGGAAWMRENRDRIEGKLGEHSSLIRRQDAGRIRRHVESSALLKRFRSGDLAVATRYEFTDMLRTSPDSPRDIIGRKFGMLRADAELVNDPEILEFLKAVSAKFHELIGGGE